MNKKVILIVDDEPNIRLLVKNILCNEYDVMEASGGNEAFRIANTQAIDLILLDIMMPEIDGYTFCSAIKHNERTSSVPIIMVTGLGLELNKSLAERIGACGYITKPFKSEDILKIVGSTLSVV